MRGIDKAQERYERWWLNQYVLRSDLAHIPTLIPKLVVQVEAQGNPSFVYGQVELTYGDGTTDYAYKSRTKFVPAKKGMTVFTREEMLKRRLEQINANY